MRKLKALILVILGLGFVLGVIFFVIGILRPKAAGILIETVPESSVFIDNVLVGQTPYQETRKPAEVVIKLVPESFDKPLVPYETKVNLISGVETVVRWDFGESYESSTGDIVSFEKVSGDETSLSVVTMPDSAQVAIDSTIRAFAPYKTSTLEPGEHVLVASATGYSERSIKLKTHTGYKLTAVVKLAPSEEEPESEATPSAETLGEESEEEVEVEILSTPTGFLRVRAEPSTLAEEIGRVEPGERYPYLDEDEETGWFKIEYEEDEEGWVSNTYAKKIEGEEESDISPTLSPTPST